MHTNLTLATITVECPHNVTFYDCLVYLREKLVDLGINLENTGPNYRNTNNIKKVERKNNNNVIQVFTFTEIPFKQGFVVYLPACVLFLVLCQ